MSDLCPKCGAEAASLDNHRIVWTCGSVRLKNPFRGQTSFSESKDCLRRQLATANEVIAKLPTCWRLVDGKLVKDVPIVKGLRLWPPELLQDESGGTVVGFIVLVRDEVGSSRDARPLELDQEEAEACGSTPEAATASAKGEVK